jgi:hypothetical protein
VRRETVIRALAGMTPAERRRATQTAEAQSRHGATLLDLVEMATEQLNAVQANLILTNEKLRRRAK